MPRINAVDEAIINSDPSTVFKALLNEFEGGKKFWMPHWEAKAKGSVPFGQPGGFIDVIVHRIGKTKLCARSVEVIPNNLIRAEFLEGDFLGDCEWVIKSEEGKTHVKFKFNVKTNRLLFTIVSPFFDIERIHADIMRKGFDGLNKYLKAK